jgi:AraC family transcriptional regulator
MILLPSRGAINFKDETRRAGTWLSEDRFVVVPKTQAHETAATRGAHSHLALYLTDGLMQHMDKRLGSLGRVRHRLTRPSVFAVTPEIRALQLLCRTGDAHDASIRLSRDYLAAALLIRILAQVEETAPLSNATTRHYGEMIAADVRAFIDAHVVEHLPLDTIAETFGLSRRHLTRLFRQWTGLSIAEYQERQRVRVARQLLTDTELPVGEIAWRVGLESGSALARAMRRATGQSPGNIRTAKKA